MNQNESRQRSCGCQLTLLSIELYRLESWNVSGSVSFSLTKQRVMPSVGIKLATLLLLLVL